LEVPVTTPTPKPKHEKFVIHIDRKEYKVEGPTITSAELRTLPRPDIGSDYDLFLDVPGCEDDLVDDGDVIKLRHGMQFYSAPTRINPGCAADR
jgi:hypothetical protein